MLNGSDYPTHLVEAVFFHNGDFMDRVVMECADVLRQPVSESGVTAVENSINSLLDDLLEEMTVETPAKAMLNALALGGNHVVDTREMARHMFRMVDDGHFQRLLEVEE